MVSASHAACGAVWFGLGQVVKAASFSKAETLLNPDVIYLVSAVILINANYNH